MSARRASLAAAVILVAGGCPGPRPGTSPASPPQLDVRLDHVLLVLDSATHQDMRSNEFLRTQFSVTEQRTTTVEGGRSWTGLYLQGRFTYIELFPPEQGRVGGSGVAFTVSISGGADELRPRLYSALGDSGTLRLITGVRQGQPQPWYYQLRVPADSNAVLNHWVMEYHPSFLQWQGIDSLRADGRTARRWTPRPRHDATRLFRDVVAFTVAAPDADRDRLRRMLQAYGWTVRPRDGQAWLASGPDITVTLTPPAAGERRGIRSLTLSLARPWPDPLVLKFGSRSTLTLRDTSAVWTFR